MKRRLRSIASNWAVWLFPLFAVLISAWLFFDYYNQNGVTVKILFDDASAIQPEKTRVRFRGVTIGTVKKVHLSEDNKDVVVEVSLQKDAENFAVEGTRFALVMPKVNISGISGLETIFEGNYISVVPGPANGKTKTEFKATASASTDDALEDSSTFFLETPNAESVNPGDIVSYRGLKVGSVTRTTLSKDSLMVVIQINIENRYAKLVRANTVFWRKLAVQAKLGLFNSELKINSFESMLKGGIDFSTPGAVGPAAKPHTRFYLEEGPPKDSDKWNPLIE